MSAVVHAVHLSPTHSFSKATQFSIRVLAGLGVDGDAHMGVTVKHRYHVKRDPTAPNLCQVHLIPDELHDTLQAAGFPVSAGQLGENITTRGMTLADLPVGTQLAIGNDVVLELTALRNPCVWIERFMPGLLAQVKTVDDDGNVVRKAGVMSIVLQGGEVHAGDAIVVTLPPLPHRALQPI